MNGSRVEDVAVKRGRLQPRPLGHALPGAEGVTWALIQPTYN
jgi:hypothetical protein